MNAKQENKLSMYLAVEAVCDRNTSTWQTLQAFGDAYTSFGAHVQNIQSIAQSQAADSTGLSADKQQLREAMAESGIEIGNAVYAYARKSKNNDLAAKVNVNRSSFMGGRDTAAADMARSVLASANANLANLGPYGITEGKLTAFQTAIDAYAASIAKPRDARASAATATRQLADEFDAADEMLGDQMDTLVLQFRSANATFVTDYQNARLIVDSTGGGSANGKDQPTPTPTPVPQPVAAPAK
ncbi:MAG TPA: hypothetical protein VMA13_01690 [Candidatus Saccharimonadales bacterium]|nr:hypothetical protein [Candidatus Saccharimonadales bacterium]